MKKSAIVATCLVNSNMIKELENAISAVQNIFSDEYPDQEFQIWDTDILESTAKNIISNVGRASRINVAKFIKNLW